MTVDRRYFIDVFADIVNEVRKVYDSTVLKKPYFMYGHPIDIAKQLTLKNNITDKLNKYPLICLLLDLPKTIDASMAYQYTVSPTILVLAETASHLTSPERTDITFKPILYPIAAELVKQINKSEHLQFRHGGNAFTWDDKYFWGKEGIKMRGYEGNVFNEYLDGIELNFKDLRILNNNCI